MSRTQVLVRDKFGGIVFNQTSPNFPLTALSLSIFLDLYEGYISSVVLLKTVNGGIEKTTFKLRRDEHWYYLEGANGDKVLLPEPPDEDYDPLSDEEDFFGNGEMI